MLLNTDALHKFDTTQNNCKIKVTNKKTRLYGPDQKPVGWIYTWSTHHDDKDVRFSRAILDEHIKLMKIPLKEWKDHTEETAKQEIIALIKEGLASCAPKK